MLFITTSIPAPKHILKTNLNRLQSSLPCYFILYGWREEVANWYGHSPDGSPLGKQTTYNLYGQQLHTKVVCPLNICKVHYDGARLSRDISQGKMVLKYFHTFKLCTKLFAGTLSEFRMRMLMSDLMERPLAAVLCTELTESSNGMLFCHAL